MTQLRLEGWIHPLARHAVACFLTRGDLWINWEEGMKVRIDTTILLRFVIFSKANCVITVYKILLDCSISLFPTLDEGNLVIKNPTKPVNGAYSTAILFVLSQIKGAVMHNNVGKV